MLKWLFIFIFGFNSYLFYSQDITSREYLASMENLSTIQIDTFLIRMHQKFINQGKTNEEMIIWNKKMLEVSKFKNYDNGIVLANLNLANRNWVVGDYEQSIKYLDSAVFKIKKINDIYIKGKIYQEYAQSYRSMGLIKMALKSSDKAIGFWKELDDPKERNHHLSYAYGSRAVYLYDDNDVDSALVYLKKAMYEFPSPVEASNIAQHYMTFVINLDSAEVYVNKSIELLNSRIFLKNNYANAVVFNTKGSLNLKLKKYDEALQNFQSSLEFAKIEKNPEVIVNAYLNLIEASKKKEDIHIENFYKEQYLYFIDSLTIARRKGIDRVLENKDQIHNSLKKKTNRVVWILITIVILSLLIFVFSKYRYNRQLANKQKDLLNKEIETKQLKRKVNASFEEVVQLAKENNSEFLARYTEVYPENIQKLLDANPKLLTSELTLLAMIWLSFSSKEIALFTFVEHKTVQTKKYRLRKKLNIPSEMDIYTWLHTL